MKLNAKILSLSGINIAVQMVILVVVINIFSSLLNGFDHIVIKAGDNKQLTQKSQKDISSASDHLGKIAGQMSSLETLISQTNSSIKILQKRITDSSETLSGVSQTVETALDSIQDEATQDLLFDVADEVSDIQESMKREALVSLQASVKSMIISTEKVRDQVVEINNISTDLGKIKNNETRVAESSVEILSTSDTLNESIGRNRVFLTTLILITAMIAIIPSIIIIRSITAPLNDAVGLAGKMAEGDFTKTINLKQKDEIGILAGALNNMGSSLGGMFRDISQGVETLTSSSTKLSAISRQISNNVEQTATQAETVSAGAEELSTNTSSVAAAMEQATTNVGMVTSAADQMAATIDEIAQNTEKARAITSGAVSQAKDASGQVGDLGEAAKAIGKVVETITEISEQVNLLALNATIEAARAGEAGKGFAVVANEIKELARQTAEATGEIKTRIEGIQSSTEGTVRGIGSISGVVTEIDEIVATIATAVEEQSVTTREIAENVTQAATGIGEVNQNVAQSSSAAGEIAEEIAKVSQGAAEMNSGSNRVSDSAGELSKLAEELNTMVGRFKV